MFLQRLCVYSILLHSRRNADGSKPAGKPSYSDFHVMRYFV